MPRRAWVLLKSGRRLNLLQPIATDWEDQDIDAPDIGFGAFRGEVQTHIHRGLGCAGVITDGSARASLARRTFARRRLLQLSIQS